MIKPQYKETPDTLSEGQFSGLTVDSTGALRITAIGTPSDTAWNGTDPEATVIALLKAIATNTAPV